VTDTDRRPLRGTPVYSAQLIDEIGQPLVVYPGLLLDDDGRVNTRIRLINTDPAGDVKATDFLLDEPLRSSGVAIYRRRATAPYHSEPPERGDYIITVS